MQIHQLQPIHKRRKAKRVGRGGTKGGTYAGKGGKGQTRRSGFNVAPIVREFIKKYPKLRAYRKRGRRETIREITLLALEKMFEPGVAITPALILEKRMVRKLRGRNPKIKVIGSVVKKALKIEGCLVSPGAKEAILKAGGSVG